jgi:chromosomal replication initiation ATPase DnaA
MRPDFQRRREHALVQQIDELRAEVERLRRQIEGAPPIAAHPSVRRLAEALGAEFGIEPAQLLSDLRVRDFVPPRQAVAWAAFHRLAYSPARIGRAMKRDRSTIVHSISTTAARLATDPAFAARVERAVQAALQCPQEVK